MNLIMENNAIVNLDNIARMVMESAIKCAKLSTYDENIKKSYLKTVRAVVDKIKANKELTSAERDSTLKHIYLHREEKSTMGEMRRILAELGSTREYVQHKVVPNAKL
ncbi:hypothetical protein pzkkv8_122 [Klebsiella phage pzk-kv8]|jgi:hypothetical protein|nr:hypothetical protein pzkkv8_122 [Klebsiella phage pzk-kv8]